jgi:hypothetical protein
MRRHLIRLSQDCCIRSGLAVIASAGSTAAEQKVPDGIDQDVVADGELRKRRGWTSLRPSGELLNWFCAILNKRTPYRSKFFQIQSPRLQNKSLPTRQLTNVTWRRIMKAVIASLLFAATITASPAFARDYSRNAAHQQGDSVYQGNQYLGSDPDPQVQFDLEREAGSRHGGY